jgi:ribonuclease P protein subunit POP4
MADMKSEVVRGEMIGRNIRVIDAKNRALIGIEGNIVDETRNTLIVETRRGRKTLLKQQVTIETVNRGKSIKIVGSYLLKRPEERIRSKVSG